MLYKDEILLILFIMMGRSEVFSVCDCIKCSKVVLKIFSYVELKSQVQLWNVLFIFSMLCFCHNFSSQDE